MKISTRVACLVACCCLVAMPRIGTGQREIQDGGKQNDESPCYLKMTSFADIVQVTDCQKVPDIPCKY